MKRYHSGIRNEYTENLRSQVTACSFLSVQMITNHLRFARFTLKFYIHNNEITLNEGDSIFFDSSHRHAMVALNDEKAKFLAIIM